VAAVDDFLAVDIEASIETRVSSQRRGYGLDKERQEGKTAAFLLGTRAMDFAGSL
jgi:hypothetical protein